MEIINELIQVDRQMVVVAAAEAEAAMLVLVVIRVATTIRTITIEPIEAVKSVPYAIAQSRHKAFTQC